MSGYVKTYITNNLKYKTMKKSILIIILSVFAYVSSFGQVTTRTYPIAQSTVCVGDTVFLQFRIINSTAVTASISGCCEIEFDVLTSPTLIGTKTLTAMTVAPNDSTALFTIKGVVTSGSLNNIRVKYYGSSCSSPQGMTKPLTPYKIYFSIPVINAITSNSVLCTGQSATLTANGANTYTWNTSASGSSIIVNPSINTNYTVTGTNSVGCTNSATITQTVSMCTGIYNNNSNKIVNKVYPNPANDNLNIELENVNENSKLTVNIYSVEGRNVFSEKIDNNINKLTLDISNLSIGMYILEITTESWKSTKNIIVAR